MISKSNDKQVTGYFLAIGGAMELSMDNPLVKKFIELANGKNAKITILPTASDLGEEVGALYAETFREFCPDTEYFVIDERKDAESPALLRRLKRSTGVFFTGGNQLRITSLLGGSKVMKLLREGSKRGIIIAGTSAGATAMSSTMISWGRADIMLKGNLQMSPAMGLINNMVIDSHFVKRGRISRLLHVVAQHPGILGIGLAEDTGILLNSISNPHVFDVVGSRQVIVVDGRDIKHSNMPQLSEHLPYSVTDVRVHVLGPNYSYDYLNHLVIPPENIEQITKISKPSLDVKEMPYRSNNKLSTHEY